MDPYQLQNRVATWIRWNNRLGTGSGPLCILYLYIDIHIYICMHTLHCITSHYLTLFFSTLLCFALLYITREIQVTTDIYPYIIEMQIYVCLPFVWHTCIVRYWTSQHSGPKIPELLSLSEHMAPCGLMVSQLISGFFCSWPFIYLEAVHIYASHFHRQPNILVLVIYSYQYPMMIVTINQL